MVQNDVHIALLSGSCYEYTCTSPQNHLSMGKCNIFVKKKLAYQATSCYTKSILFALFEHCCFCVIKYSCEQFGEQEAQLPLRNRASAMHIFVAKLLSIAVMTYSYIYHLRNLHPRDGLSCGLNVQEKNRMMRTVKLRTFTSVDNQHPDWYNIQKFAIDYDASVIAIRMTGL